MTAKAYYITSLADWQRHAPRFANSHFVVISPARHSERSAPDATSAPTISVGTPARAVEESLLAPNETSILVLIEADEGVHLSLEDDSAFEPLPHPLAQKPISAAAQSALAPHGVAPGATTFDAAETLARIHPLLKHRVF